MAEELIVKYVFLFCAFMCLPGCGGDDASVSASVEKLAASDDASDRAKAVDGLRHDQSEKGRMLLVELAKDPVPGVAIKAMYVAAETPKSVDRQLMSDQMKNESPRVRGAAAYLLGRSEKLTDEQFDSIRTQLNKDNDAEARAGAAKGLSAYLGKGKEEQIRTAMPQLLHALSDKDEQVRIWTYKAINSNSSTKFEFDPRASPAEQAERVKAIEAFMKRVGFYGKSD